MTELGGITSTLVENTIKITEGTNYIKDHLHTRGEYSMMIAVLPGRGGSPPHSWRIH